VPDFAREAERSRAAKVALRNRLLAGRRSLTTSDRLSAAESVQAVLLSLIRTQHTSVVTAYVPVGPEPGGPDLPSVLAEALPPHGRLLLPVLLDDNDLDWATYPGRLEPGPRGLRQPPGPRLGVDAVRTAGLLIVPALAVDRAGHRLGRGGGSYDRALSRLDVTSDTLITALLHDGEFLDAVPAEPHDRVVDAVITPSGGLALRKGGGWTK
jgi:5-formyltetrahydrofolate cyclo-ligase